MKATNFKKLSYLMAGSISLSILSGCGGTNGNANGGNSTLGETLPTVEKVKKVYFDEVGIVPLDAGNAQFALRLNNSYDERFTLDDIYAVDPVTHTRNNSLASISKGNCAQVPSNNYCTVNYSSKLNKNGAFIVEAQLTNTKTGKKLVQRQFVRVGHLNDLNGLEFRAELDEVPAINKHFSMALPVYVKGDFKELKAKDGLKGKLLCAGEATKGGTACTYLVDGDVLAGKTSVQTRIEGISKNGKTVNLSSNTVVNTNREGHLLVSIPENIDMNNITANSTFTVDLFNNGSNEVNSINPTPGIAGLTIDNAASDCKTATLLAGEDCTVTYKADPAVIADNKVGSITSAYKKKKDNGIGTTETIENGSVFAHFLMTWAGITNPGIIIDPTTGKPVIDPATQCRPPLGTGTGTINCETSGTINQNMLLTVTGSPADLNGTPVSTPRDVIYRVHNDSKRAIKDIKITSNAVTSSGAILTTSFTPTAIAGSTCDVTAGGSFTLAAGSDCTFKATLQEASAVNGYNQVIVSGKYADAINAGQELTASGYTVTPFGVNTLLNLYTISPANRLFNTSANNTVDQVYTVSNTSSLPFTYQKPELVASGSGAANAEAIKLLAGGNNAQLKIVTSTEPGTKCDLTAATALAGGEDCTFKVEFKPTGATNFLTAPFKLNVPITQINGTTAPTNSKIVADLSAYAGQRAAITGALSRASVTSLGSPAAIHFHIPGANPLTVDYVFTNKGGTAQNFNVAVNSLPLGIKVLQNQAPITIDNVPNVQACEIGISRMDLNKDMSCYIRMQLPDADFFNSGLLQSGALDFVGEVSYNDSEEGLKVLRGASEGLDSFSKPISGEWVNIDVTNTTTALVNQQIGTATVEVREVSLDLSFTPAAGVTQAINGLRVVPVTGMSGMTPPVTEIISGNTATVKVYLPKELTSYDLELKLVDPSLNNKVVRSIKHSLTGL